MATPSNNPTQENASGRGANAKRFGKFGLLIGAVVGLLSGGGVPAILQFALLGGGASALGGAVAGDKLNPLVDKVFGMLPGRKKAPEAPQVEIPQIDENRQAVFQLLDDPEQAQSQQAQPEKAAAPATGQYRPVSAIDSTVLENARAATSASVRSAGEGMDPNAQPMTNGRLPEEWVSRNAEGKRANHAGSVLPH